MSGLKNMAVRINYAGGSKQEDRMIADKLRSLRKALLYSYQAETAELSDGRQFRCLINPNKVTMDLDDKVLSIPFRDICLNGDKSNQTTNDTEFIQENTNAGKGKTSESYESIDLSVGSVFKWVETDTHWIIYSQYLTENAYFRGMARQCEDEALDINGKTYYYYLKGPDEKGIDWQKTKHFIFNDLNYTVEMYISKTTETNEFFHRFKKLKLKGKPFEVQAVDDISSDGILTVYLKEDYTNEWIETQVEEKPPVSEDNIDLLSPRIEGPIEVYPYDIVNYNAINISGGIWSLSNKRAKIIKQSDTSVEIEIITGKSGDISLIYTIDRMEIVYNISILSL